MKIVTVVGARPQFVKAAVVSRAIRRDRSGLGRIEEILVHTGQHFDERMSAVFFEQMEIPIPDHNLHVNGLGHGAMTGQMLIKIEQILIQERPDWVLVYGDTNSTLAGALAASKLNIKVAHVEAGLRSFNMRMPEEVNRVLTDRVSDLLLCPTQVAMDNLSREGYDALGISKVLCGDVMYDAVRHYEARASRPSEVDPEVKFVLSTIHRQENTDDPERLSSIFDALADIAERTKVVLPLHPRTVNKLDEFDIRPRSNLQVLDPIGYFEMLWLISRCKAVVTDSGGLQKEAFFLSKPCITVRDETEWQELLEVGVNLLAGAERSGIVRAYDSIDVGAMDFGSELYGSGDAGEKIVGELIVHGSGTAGS